MSKRAVLLVNLGSPKSTSVDDVRRYLREFLGDERVLDLPAFFRWLLLEGIILRTRPRKSARAYARIWTPQGSPLLVTSLAVQARLAQALGPDTPVYLAMRYGEPSITSVLRTLEAEGVTDLLVIPQYPHYAMSSWETVTAKVREVAQRLPSPPRLTVEPPFYADPAYIAALVESARPYLEKPYDHVLFSFHGLPVRHLRKADSSRIHCTQVDHCCDMPSPAHATCYRAQCFMTARAFAQHASLPADRYSVSFQSRLAGEPWMQPFTDQTLRELPNRGIKNLLVITPAFVTDCLETLEEIAITGKEQFLEAGGSSFRQIPCLNDHPTYIHFLLTRTQQWQERE